MKINIINLQYNFILLILYTKINQMITIIIIIHILTFFNQVLYSNNISNNYCYRISNQSYCNSEKGGIPWRH